ncbi:MAG: DNA repair protein RecN [Bacteroidaceae bacterium]|nr:DNA repair protein RecN [Bacteroidaceae bacterium]
MLQSIYIKNYALIEELHMDFHRGFSVITGETGAGKSILLGAIGLLLGQRAEARMLQAGANRCVIEAEFDLSDYHMDSFFESEDLDFDGHSCIIRRELTSSGKSRAFINDTPASVSQLRLLGSRLIDIHSQHQNLLLAQEDFQLSVVDILVPDKSFQEHYRSAYDAYRSARSALHAAREAARRDSEEEEYLRYQVSQFDQLQPSAGKQAEYELEARQLEHAEELKETLWTVETALQGNGTEQSGCLQTLHEATRHMQAIQSLLPEAQTLAERLDSCRIELHDIADELASHAEHIEVSPSRLQEVTEWLSTLYSIQQKHHVASEEELLQLMEGFRERLQRVENAEQQLQELEQAYKQAEDALRAAGKRLTKARSEAAQVVEQQMVTHLQSLGLPNVKFAVSITPRTEPDVSGYDQVSFLFSANKNGHPEPISAVASGGEIARVMLSLKALISSSVNLPTIIFDEIDTGVSGQIAERMAVIMRQMGDGGRQVISITHLPQIAALGQHHYRVYKEDGDNATTSHIVELTPEERVSEIAHLLSGSELTEAAIENAKALLRGNGK